MVVVAGEANGGAIAGGGAMPGWGAVVVNNELSLYILFFLLLPTSFSLV